MIAASLSNFLDQSQWRFHVLVSNTSYFENSTQEFHPYESLSAPIKLLSSLFLLTWCHISTFNAHKTLIKLH